MAEYDTKKLKVNEIISSLSRSGVQGDISGVSSPTLEASFRQISSENLSNLKYPNSCF